MPAKNIVKRYENNAYYHIYNRGVEKRTIFQDEQGHNTFIEEQLSDQEILTIKHLTLDD